jgi:hypothetical protein
MAKSGKKKQTPKKVGVIVLGMHRSGTSALGGMLSMLGCDAPSTLMPPHPTNPKGFFESSALWHLNDDLLKTAGSCWNDWQPFNSAWFESPKATAFSEQIKSTVLSEFPESRLFVLKDPRLCRLLPVYLDVFKQIGVRPVIAHVHRNPLDVAASLHARDALDPELGRLIWLRHVLDAERNSRGLRRSFLSYDQLLRNWAGAVDRLGKELKISWPRFSSVAATEIDDFLTPSLRHHEAAKEQVLENPLASAWVRDTYAILERWAEHGETEADIKKLDAIAAELSRGAGTFARLIEAGQLARQTAGKAEAELASAKAEASRLRKEQADAVGQVEQLNLKIAEMAHQLTTAQDAHAEEIDTLRTDSALALAQAKEDAAEGERAKVKVLLDNSAQLRSALLQRQHEAQEWAERARKAEDDLTHKARSEERLSSEITGLAARLAQHGQDLDSREKELAAQKRAFDQQSNDLATLSRDLIRVQDVLKQERALWKTEREMLRTTTTKLEHDLTAQRALLRQTAAAEAVLRQDVQDSQAQIADQAAQIAQVSHVRDALLNSTSWKLTAPLRRIMLLFRKGS